MNEIHKKNSEDTVILNRSDYEKLVSEREEYRNIALAFSERYQAIKEKIGGASQ